MENKILKINCPNCGSDSSFWGKKKSYDLFRCNSCKLIFVHPIPNPDLIYNKDYFSGAKEGFGYVDYDEDKEPMIPTFEKYLDLIKKYGKSSGSLFDVGAATGFFLKIAQDRGFSVSGVEMSDYAASVARKSGLDVLTGDLLSQNLLSNSFDGVTMIDVLEHMTNPFAELREVSRIMKPGGLLIVNSPNGESFLSKFLKTNWHLVLPPEHIYYFSPRNLGKFLESSGFKTVYTGSIGKRFTLQYIFKMLYKWQGLGFWNWLSNLFSKSQLYIPINLHDNFFMIFQKTNENS